MKSDIKEVIENSYAEGNDALTKFSDIVDKSRQYVDENPNAFRQFGVQSLNEIDPDAYVTSGPKVLNE